jgi:hypothetical protein
LSGKDVFRATALSLAVASLITGTACESGTPEDEFTLADGSLQGELAIYIADDPETGVHMKYYAIRGATGEERPLDLDGDPGLEPGTRIRVWGNQLGERMRVTDLRRVVPPAATVTSELRNGTKYNPKRLALVLLDIGGGTNLTPENALREIVGPSTNNDPPLRNYYAEASYGTEELDGRVFGPFDYSIGSCNYNGVRTAFKSMVDQMGGGTFNHYLWYFGSRTSACSWAGLGAVGTPQSPARDTWYNGSSSCVVMIQEPGHNFGMQHSSSMDCGSASFHDTPQGNCTHSEYGDPYDPMGGGCRHTNGWQKAYQGWTQGCNMVRVRSSGTFTLLPLELPCDGAQVLQIPMGKTRMFMRSGGGGSATNDALTHYYLELRTKRGVDTSLTTSVHVRVSGDFRGRTQPGLHTWILDMDPSSSTFNGLGLNGTFRDPAGNLSFTVTELDENHATINVEMQANGGGPVCLDGTTAFTTPGPGIDSCNPGIATPTGGAGGGAGGRGGSGGAGGSTGGVGGGNAGRGGGTAGSGGGSAGRGGSGGTAGTGGGNAGRGGSGGGAAGTGGTAGAAGTTGGSAAGSGGGAGSMGNAGNGAGGSTGGIGIGGSAGPGTGGTPGTAGDNGGTGAGGTGIVITGVAGATGTAGQGGKGPGIITGGCNCETGGGAQPGLAAMMVLACVLVARTRRRRGRSRANSETTVGGS